MNLKLISFVLCTSFFLLYYLTIIAVQVDDDKYFTTFYTDSCNVLRRSNTPKFAVAVRVRETPFTFSSDKLTMSNCNWTTEMYRSKWKINYRPIVGDHIHLGIAIRENGKDLTLHDRDMTEPISYEDFHPAPSCKDPPRYAYIKKWYHTGIHTHCDNIVHVHPWSAPKQLRVEGRDVTLKMWFESVGIEVGSIDNTLRMPGSDYQKGWRLEYYIHVNDIDPVFVTTKVEEMSNLWLVDHHGFIKLWIGTAPDKSYKVLEYYSKSKLGSYPIR